MMMSLFNGTVDVVATVVMNSWTSGQRLDLGDPSSPYVWKQLTTSEQTNVPVGYTRWGPGEPNLPGTESCLLLYYSLNYAWVDAQCEGTHNAVCEIDLA